MARRCEVLLLSRVSNVCDDDDDDDKKIFRGTVFAPALIVSVIKHQPRRCCYN